MKIPFLCILIISSISLQASSTDRQVISTLKEIQKCKSVKRPLVCLRPYVLPESLQSNYMNIKDWIDKPIKLGKPQDCLGKVEKSLLSTKKVCMNAKLGTEVKRIAVEYRKTKKRLLIQNIYLDQ